VGGGPSSKDVAEGDAGTGAAHFGALSSFQPVGAK